jgi:hypothetical protein
MLKGFVWKRRVAVLENEETCNAVVVLDANILVASVLPTCRRKPKSGYTLIRLLALSQIYQVCMYIPERLTRFAQSKIVERCREIAAQRNLRKSKVAEVVERALNSLEELLENIGVRVIEEREYSQYLNYPLVKSIGDANDDEHLIALALYLKETFKLNRIYVLSRDYSIPHVDDLQRVGIVITSDFCELESES